MNHFALTIVLALLVLSSRANAQSNPELAADELWNTRFELAQISKSKLSNNVEKAITLYEAALAKSPENRELRFKLMEASYYLGFFLTDDQWKQRRLFERVAELSEKNIDDVNKAAGIRELDDQKREEQAAKLRAVPGADKSYFWGAISWGLWGMSHSYLSSGRHDVGRKIERYSKMLIAIDDKYANAGGYRLLGRLNTETPIIPLFTDWIDRDAGIKYLEAAKERSTAEVRNLSYLAEAYLDYETTKTTQAIALLKEACARTPSKEHYLEEKFDIDNSCTSLEEAEKANE